MDERKERLLEGVRDWLKSIDTESFEPEKYQGETPDLFTLLSELAALKSEVRIESRQLKAALEEFRDLFDGLRRANAQLAAELEDRRERESVRLRGAENDLLLELVELRDRLVAGRDYAAGYRPGWLARRGRAKDFADGMIRGVKLNLQRLEEIMARRDVRPIDTLGRPFDPRFMTALASGCDPTVPANQVLEETRPGYRRGSELLRAAEVVVNKRDSSD